MIYLKSEEQITFIRKAGSIVSGALSLIAAQAIPSATGLQLDKLAEDFIRSQGGIPSCKGYHDYPSSICCSVNHQAVHCIPTSTPFKEGDVIKLDLTASYNGWNADSAITVIIPPVKPEVVQLVTTTYKAMLDGIRAAKEGNSILDVSKAIYAARGNCGVIKEFCGHGIGKEIHEPPQINNIPIEGKDTSLIVAGEVLCIEPIFCIGDPAIYMKKGDWNTWVLSGHPVSHWEHTVLITSNGPEILTKRLEENIP